MPTYFAYGSNLCAAQMRQRCPGAIAIGRASLPGHRLAFVGHSSAWDGAVATVQPARGSVQGVLWQVSADDLVTLDFWEGAPVHYIRRTVEVLDYRRRPVQALLYEARSQTLGRPSERYLNQIARGMEDFGLDAARLHQAVERSAGAPDGRPPGGTGLAPVFVYGTLRESGANHARFLGRAPAARTNTARGFDLHDLGAFPAMVRSGGSGRVLGEVYHVTPDELRALDLLEGTPTLYQREIVPLSDGGEAWAYLMPAERAGRHRRIEGGDWMAGRVRDQSRACA